MQNYKAKVTVRSKGKFCVKFPKKLVDSGNFSLGDIVDVSIQRAESGSSDHANDHTGGAV